MVIVARTCAGQRGARARPAVSSPNGASTHPANSACSSGGEPTRRVAYQHERRRHHRADRDGPWRRPSPDGAAVSAHALTIHPAGRQAFAEPRRAAGRPRGRQRDREPRAARRDPVDGDAAAVRFGDAFTDAQAQAVAAVFFERERSTRKKRSKSLARSASGIPDAIVARLDRHSRLWSGARQPGRCRGANI